ncbi:hypothetical protein [Paenibacillus fonticola]|uniref:hypothetical protein n=1 Tax=Paenibacillus fonticola TaxID=379896 RepID=UPI00036D43D7|nr:hypothetical protein [Paenibacillus fonticola]
MAFIQHVTNVPTPITNGAAINVPQTPAGQGIALVEVSIPANTPVNTVELTATVGLQGLTGVPRILFRIFRDGHEIYYAAQGVEANFESLNLTTLTAVDTNVASGVHAYILSVEQINTATNTARVIGPIVFSALVTAP